MSLWNYWMQQVPCELFLLIILFCCFVVSFFNTAQQLTFSHYRYFAMSAWVNGLFWALMPIFGWSRYDIDSPLQTSCFVDWQRIDLSYVSYIVSWFIVNFVLPLSLMVFCYVSAFLTRQEEAGEAEEGQFAAADPIRNDEPSPTNVDWASQPEAHWVSWINTAR